MADPLSIAASIVGVANVGAKLASILYTYAETAFHADRNLKEVARDVSLTSSVIRELGDVLQHEDGPTICSDNAVKTAEDTVNGCREVFQDIDSTLSNVVKSRTGAKGKISAVGRLVWPWKEQRLQVVLSNLDRLKSTLMLMIQVLQYARLLMTEERRSIKTTEQREQVQTLVKVNRRSSEVYEALVADTNNVHVREPSASTTNISFRSNLIPNQYAPTILRGAKTIGSIQLDEILGLITDALAGVEGLAENVHTDVELRKSIECYDASYKLRESLTAKLPLPQEYKLREHRELPPEELIEQLKSESCSQIKTPYDSKTLVGEALEQYTGRSQPLGQAGEFQHGATQYNDPAEPNNNADRFSVVGEDISELEDEEEDEEECATPGSPGISSEVPAQTSPETPFNGFSDSEWETLSVSADVPPGSKTNLKTDQEIVNAGTFSRGDSDAEGGSESLQRSNYPTMALMSCNVTRDRYGVEVHYDDSVAVNELLLKWTIVSPSSMLDSDESKESVGKRSTW